MRTIYQISKQEKPFFCIPASIQAILRRRGLEEEQEAIAREIDCTEKGAIFGENLQDFFRKRKLDFIYFNYNEVPFNDLPVLVKDELERDSDVFLGYKPKPLPKDRIHVRLVTSIREPNVDLVDPEDCLTYRENIYEIERNMGFNKIGGVGIIRR